MSKNGKRILIVDDDINVRKSLKVGLQNAGFSVATEPDPVIAAQKAKGEEFDVLVLDICLGELSGIDLYKKLRADGVTAPVIFMSGGASLTDAVRAVRMGAFDFLEKPFSAEKLSITIDRALEFSSIKTELKKMRDTFAEDSFIGQSPGFKKLLQQIQKVAPTQSIVLIEGESGTGKELIARQVHTESKVARGPFIKVNCSAIPESLFESEFFGHEKGAFTGALNARKGFFEQAEDGTLLLDEVGELSLNSQAKLLRALQSSEIQRLGSEKTTTVRVRVIASTNRDLTVMVKNKTFREDLFFRLNVFAIRSIPLRERNKDIPLLVEFFLNHYLKINQMPHKILSPEVQKLLNEYPWPGNIRELKNAIERLTIVGGQTIVATDLPSYITNPGEKPTNYGKTLKEFRYGTEREFIIKTLVVNGGNISEAAQQLGIERTYLHKKIQQYKIKKKDYFA